MRGFTLIEVLIAVVILGVSLTVIFSVITQAVKLVGETENNFNDLISLDEAIKLEKPTNAQIEEKLLKEYNLKAIIYRKGRVELIKIQ